MSDDDRVSTKRAAELLGVTPERLNQNAKRRDGHPQPSRDGQGARSWSQRELILWQREQRFRPDHAPAAAARIAAALETARVYPVPPSWDWDPAGGTWWVTGQEGDCMPVAISADDLAVVLSAVRGA